MSLLLYRIIPKAEWADTVANREVPLCGADERDGFVHLSTVETLLETAGLYFTPDEEPIALEIESTRLGDSLKWEPVGSRGGVEFPHLYGGGIPLESITGVVVLVADGVGQFRLGPRSDPADY